MNLRNISLTGEQSSEGFFFTLQGIIQEATGLFTGTITLIEADGTVTTEPMTGTIPAIGANPETLPVAPASATPALAVLGSVTIQPDGSAALSLTGLAPDAITAVASVMTGSATAYPVQFETPQLAGGGLEVLNGATINEPCALADQLEVARLQLISGQQVTRTEFSGRSLYFKAGDLSELNLAIAKYRALCAGTTSTPVAVDPASRTRRQIRINPWS
jgi:hypothetical protein